MPDSIVDLLAAEDGKSNTLTPLPILADLLHEDLSHRNGMVHLCASDALQVWKLKQEGAHFCGYRNVQMLLYAIESDFEKSLPACDIGREVYAIPKVQDMIETAWNRGFNAHGGIQTGGVRGTRKHVGTSEVSYLDIFSMRDAWLIVDRPKQFS